MSYLAAGEARDLGNGHAVIEKPSPYGRPIAKWAKSFGDGVRGEIEAINAALIDRFGSERAQRMTHSGRNLLIFPNLVINDAMGLTVRTFTPRRPDYMDVSAWQMGSRSESPLLREKRLDAYLTFLGPGGFATPDDIEALESCQKGYAADGVVWSDLSRGIGQVALPLGELQMRAFWRRWQSLLTAEKPTEVR